MTPAIGPYIINQLQSNRTNRHHLSTLNCPGCSPGKNAWKFQEGLPPPTRSWCPTCALPSLLLLVQLLQVWSTSSGKKDVPSSMVPVSMSWRLVLSPTPLIILPFSSTAVFLVMVNYYKDVVRLDYWQSRRHWHYTRGHYRCVIGRTRPRPPSFSVLR